MAYELGMNSIGLSSKSESFLKARALVKEDLPALAPCARSRNLYFKKYLELIGQYTAKKHQDLTDTYEQVVVQSIQTQWVQLGRDHLFLKLKSLCPKIFIITNETLRTQTAKLTVMDPDGKYFCGMITSEEVGFEKPNPYIFQRALKTAAVDADQALMIGDSFEKDIQAADKMGIKSIQTLEFKKNEKKGNVTIHQLDELPALLSQL